MSVSSNVIVASFKVINPFLGPPRILRPQEANLKKFFFRIEVPMGFPSL